MSLTTVFYWFALGMSFFFPFYCRGVRLGAR